MDRFFSTLHEWREKRPDILFVSNSEVFGGRERVLVAEAEALTGLRCCAICHGDSLKRKLDAIHVATCAFPGFKRVGLSRHGWPWVLRVVNLMCGALLFIPFCFFAKPRIILVTSRVTLALSLAGALSARAMVICHEHETPEADQLWDWKPFGFLCTHLGLIRHGFVPSNFALKKLLGNGYPATKFSVLYTGVPQQNRSRIRSDITPANLVHVSDLAPSKGCADSLRIAALLVNKGLAIRLHFFGSGLMREELEKSTEELGMQSAVIFHGFVENVNEMYDGAFMTILPTYRDNLPTCLIEGFSYGVPALSYRTGGVDEIVTHGKTGFLADTGNWAALAESAFAIALDKPLHTSMSLACLDEAKVRFSKDRFCDQVREYASTLLNRNSAGCD